MYQQAKQPYVEEIALRLYSEAVDYSPAFYELPMWHFASQLILWTSVFSSVSGDKYVQYTELLEHSNEIMHMQVSGVKETLSKGVVSLPP